MRKAICDLILLVAIGCALLALGGCSHARVVKIKCPADPQMREVTVRGGKIEGESLTNIKLNHLKLWKHIGILKRLGCIAAVSPREANEWIPSKLMNAKLSLPKPVRYICVTVPYTICNPGRLPSEVET